MAGRQHSLWQHACGCACSGICWDSCCVQHSFDSHRLLTCLLACPLPLKPRTPAVALFLYRAHAPTLPTTHTPNATPSLFPNSNASLSFHVCFNAFRFSTWAKRRRRLACCWFLAALCGSARAYLAYPSLQRLRCLCSLLFGLRFSPLLPPLLFFFFLTWHGMAREFNS